MNPEERDRLAEQFVNKALGRYGAAEPRTGLEGRVLARLSEAHPVANTGRQGWATQWFTQWLGWRWAAAATAVIMVAVGIHWLRPTTYVTAPNTSASSVFPVVKTPVPEPTIPVASAAKKPPKALPQRTQGTRRNAATIARNATHSSPRLAQFPAPAPLSEQERLLLSYLRQTPKEEVVAVVKQNEQFEQQLREAEQSRADNDTEEK